MKVNFIRQKGSNFLVEGTLCHFDVTSFTNHADLYNALERMQRHEHVYKAVFVRICDGINNEPVYQILWLLNNMYEFYKAEQERREAMGA